ncbi:hypothetical protein HMPREF9306_00018 [Propionimicrobium lymphophilum ACS-093-V-SCH5]|uniref:Glycosyl transferase family 1 domain-containing protein n=1 Tax=Propionimicrobium lymphophilum ACS-093-V-SCH5 TaxID=883161 RepID=S2W6X8_9ACTN|nr:glycosyltransferase [Propionimicrobium lymphophilum]EPD33985.1 hypothetical protein HMPREF9306_00018 [Propionimicrobium lymphophilum ACS-093-V-SCH5]
MGNDLVNSISDAAPGRKIRVSLTDEAREIFGFLGHEWLKAVIRSVCLAHTDESISLVLLAADTEPMFVSNSHQLHLEDDFSHNHGLGLISLDLEKGRRIRRRVSIPSLPLYKDELPYKFGSTGSLLKRKIGSIYSKVYSKAPVLLDCIRQYRNVKKDWMDGTCPKGAPELFPLNDAVSKKNDQFTAWFAFHWLEPGGAESWAFKAAELARDAGMRVVITADKTAPQRALERALKITDEVYLGGNLFMDKDWPSFNRKLAEKYNFDLVFIHHSSTVYDFLPELKLLCPNAKIYDSTHIIEHRTGGYVRSSVELSNLVDLHHVISPVLRDFYLHDCEIDPEKIAYKPLTGLDAQDDASERIVPPVGVPLKVGFIGRLAPQKRPFLFVELVKRLHKSSPGSFKFVMQGSGSLNKYVSEQIKKAGLTDLIDRREWGPADEFYAEIDVLVICSDNEGLTLTALEADTHNVVVVSADVGSQVSVVAPDMLLDAQPLKFLRQAKRVIKKLASDREYFDSILETQHSMHQRVREIQPAVNYFANLFGELVKEDK